MANVGYDLCETYVSSKLHKKMTDEMSEKRITNGSEDEKVSSHNCFFWRSKKVALNSNARSTGSAEKLATLELK